MIAVNEINIGVAGGAKEDGCARSITGGGMSRWILFAEVGLDFDDSSGETKLADVPDEYFSKQFASNGAGAAGEERAIERTNRRM